MDEVVKVKLHQNMVNYRRELSFGYVETYPLPTPSMVRGMAHALLGLTDYQPLKIGIQGTYETIITNMQKVVKFDRVRQDDRLKGRSHIRAGGSQKAVISGVMYIDLIVNMDLVLHIGFKAKQYNEALKEALLTKPVILGRNEDFARLDCFSKNGGGNWGAKLVKLKEFPGRKLTLKHNIYLSRQFCREEEIRGTVFNLPFCYEAVQNSTAKRLFRYVDVVYVPAGKTLRSGKYIVDEDDDPVSLLEAPDG